MTTLCAINTVCTTNSSNVLKIKMMSILLQKDYLATQNYPAMWTLILDVYKNY